VSRARRVTAVSIAGSDSGGGAGIQADVLAFAAHGVHAATVLVAATAQNTRGVAGAEALSPRFVAAQLDAVFSDLAPAAVKIGMLFGPRHVRAVAAGLRRHSAGNVVLDPVLAASSGARLLSPAGLAALRVDLLPLCDLVTPNLPEAEVLAGHPVDTPGGAREAARRIAAFGARAVLVKGGHGAGDRIRDVLWTGRRFRVFESPRIPTGAIHGTGCALSSAIAANLALGFGLETAVARGIRYVRAALRRRYFPGAGRGVPGHLPARKMSRPS
jgi:hydroxymethylpyrimidine/phosphomethylpyrimidine kinase